MALLQVSSTPMIAALPCSTNSVRRPAPTAARTPVAAPAALTQPQRPSRAQYGHRRCTVAQAANTAEAGAGALLLAALSGLLTIEAQGRHCKTAFRYALSRWTYLEGAWSCNVEAEARTRRSTCCMHPLPCDRPLGRSCPSECNLGLSVYAAFGKANEHAPDMPLQQLVL